MSTTNDPAINVTGRDDIRILKGANRFSPSPPEDSLQNSDSLVKI